MEYNPCYRTVRQQKESDALRAELKEQRAFIQMVNDKVELNRPAPRKALPMRSTGFESANGRARCGSCRGEHLARLGGPDS